MIIIFLIILFVTFIIRLLLVLDTGDIHTFVGSSEKSFNKIVTTLDEVLGVKKYEKNTDNELIKSTIINKHDGQRKLFMAELRFLNHIPISNDKLRLIVYIGAAPGMHMYTLSLLRPDLKFLLVDPNEFFLIIDRKNDKITSHYDTLKETNNGEKPSSHIVYLHSTNVNMYDDNGAMRYTEEPSERNILCHDMKTYLKGNSPNMEAGNIMKYIQGSDSKIFIYENYFTNDMAKIFKNTCPDDMEIFLISDIRTTTNKDGSPDEIDILWNNAMMMNFVDALSPKMICHKHRPGWPDIQLGPIADYMIPAFDYVKETYGIDMVADYNAGKLTFFAGTIYMQPWTSIHSTETRLIASINEKTNTYDLREYDLHEYDSKMNYYNTVTRVDSLFDNVALRCTCMNDKCEQKCTMPIGIDHCADCSLEANILHEYGMRGKGLIDYMKSLHLYMSPGSTNIADLHGRQTKRIRQNIGRHIDRHNLHVISNIF